MTVEMINDRVHCAPSPSEFAIHRWAFTITNFDFGTHKTHVIAVTFRLRGHRKGAENEKIHLAVTVVISDFMFTTSRIPTLPPPLPN